MNTPIGKLIWNELQITYCDADCFSHKTEEYLVTIGMPYQITTDEKVDISELALRLKNTIQIVLKQHRMPVKYSDHIGIHRETVNRVTYHTRATQEELRWWLEYSLHYHERINR